MEQPATSSVSSLPSAFAQACRLSRTEPELLERCRRELADRFETDQVWLTVQSDGDLPNRVGPTVDRTDLVEVARWSGGQTSIAVTTVPDHAQGLRAAATPLAFGLALVLELRLVLLERQEALDDAVFQLRALRQVARLLSSAHSTEETEHLVLDFVAEVFFSWWACLYRVAGAAFVPRSLRSLDLERVPGSISRERLEAAVPLGSGIADPREVARTVDLPPGAELLVPLDAGGERVAVLVLGARLNGLPYGPAERDLAATLAFAGAIALKNADLVERLQNAATTDTLTGVFNRRAIEDRLQAEISRSVRHQIRTTVVLIDLDRFKQVNDTLGHAGGDRYLVLVSQILQRHVRTLDVIGRLGGDEFIVLLPMTSPQEAIGFIHRVRTAFRALLQEHPEFVETSMSFGLAEAPRHGLTPAAVVEAADAALYAAKRQGGNAVVVAESP
ncbi:MAG: sensor domain-containing diguanylate cyclase [Gemmatimonadales bacterium]